MELFDKKFVHFMWDDSLDGKWGFCSSNIQSLQMFVEAGADPRRWKEGTPPYFLKKGTEKEPFMVQGLGFFSFAYYDPNYSVKWAYYKEGKKVQHLDGLWIDDDEPIWIEGLEYRVKPEEKTVVAKRCRGCIHEHCSATKEPCVSCKPDSCKYEAKEEMKDEKPECPCEDGIDSKACVGCEHSEDGKRKYKPYVTVDEFLQDYQERFPTAVPRPDHTMPLIWLRRKNEEQISFVTDFIEGRVRIEDAEYTMAALLDIWTFLDGSPCGNEC